MSWVVIIQIIISVLSMILEFLNGGGFPKPKTLVADAPSTYHLVDYDWNCGSPFWSEKAEVVEGEFRGTVSLDCEVQGVKGGGIRALRAHLVDQVYQTAHTVNGAAVVKTVAEMPATSQAVTMALETEEETYQLDGESTIATNGQTRLRHLFQTKSIPNQGSLKYLRSMANEVAVETSTREGWYRVRFSNTSRIAKPWYVGTSTFKNLVVEKNEEKINARKQRLLNDLAANL